MRKQELRRFAVRSLRGRYAAAWSAAMLYPSVQLVMQLLPAWLAAVLIASGGMTPRSLFFGRPHEWMLFAVLWGLMRFLLLMPIRCGTCSWFTHLVGLEEKGQPQLFFRRVRDYLHGVRFFAAAALVRLAALLPFTAACTLAAVCLRKSMETADDGLWLFAALQAAAGAVWSGLFYLRFRLLTTAVPYLFIARPERPALRTIRESCRIMHGSCRKLVLLVLSYLPAMLPMITIPFLLPYLYTEVTLLVQVRIREYEQERSRYGADIPHGAFRPMHRRRIPAP